MEKQYARASFIDIVKYSFGGVGSNLAFLFVMFYLTYFYTDIFGISSMAVATLMLVSRFIDAFTDPIMGIIADHTNTKWGKYRPWILFGAPLLGISLFVLFTSPNLSPTMKIVYAYVTYIAYSLISTVVNIPYHSLTPVMSEDPQQRTVIVTWKQGMSVIPQFLITILALPMVEALGGGQKGWATFGAFIGILTTVSFYICAAGGKKYDIPKEKKEKKEKINFANVLKLLVKNKPMVMLMIAFGTDVLANASANAVNVYYFKYVLNRMDLVSVTATVMLVTGLLAIPLLPILTKLLGKKRLYWLGSACSIFPLLVTLIWPTPTNAVLMTSFGIFGLVSKFPAFLGWAMLPECSDYAQWKFGQRADGLMSSSLTFINKFGMAIGGFIASFFLGLVGFVANEAQPQEVVNMIVLLRFGLPILGYIASLISMWFYEIDNNRYAQIRAELDLRNEEEN